MSKQFSLNFGDARSVIITLILAAIAQLIAVLPTVDFGQNQELTALVILAVLKFVQKFLQGK